MANILIIEDRVDMRDMMRLLLEHDGHIVHEAENGRLGIQAFLKTPVDVVICDIYMPEKDGLETIMEIRRNDPTARIVAISGGAAGMPDFLASARHFGASATLRKPFDGSELVQCVNSLLA